MPFGPFGGVILDGIQFSTDPDPYQPLIWEKRQSRHLAIGGHVVIQDFGTFLRDNTLNLGSGQSRFLEEKVVKGLHKRFRAQGKTYLFSDWIGNVFFVFIHKFEPVPFKKGGDNDGVFPNNPSVVSLYTYTMGLYVTQIVKLFGDAYPGVL